MLQTSWAMFYLKSYGSVSHISIFNICKFNRRVVFYLLAFKKNHGLSLEGNLVLYELAPFNCQYWQYIGRLVVQRQMQLPHTAFYIVEITTSLTVLFPFNLKSGLVIIILGIYIGMENIPPWLRRLRRLYSKQRNPVFFLN